MSRIGIFGGSFNPPHLGHTLAIQEFQEKLALDVVLLIPAAVPPHKTLTDNSASAEQRLAMCRLAVQEMSGVQVLDMELKRQGKSYTADTVDLLRQQYPDDELFLLMGTDMFLSFESWYQPRRITAQATLAVAHRSKDDKSKLQACAAVLTDKLDARTVFVENTYLPYSSTSVRAMLAFRAAEDYLAPAVFDYIQSHHLYLADKDMKGLPFDELSGISLSLHNPNRVKHVQGCSVTAEQLALRYGVNFMDAKRAGILHDITKALGPDEQLKLCKTYDILLDNFERKYPKLLHAKTGAVIAERIFGENKAVCQAITWHTTGKEKMSTLEKIIYLADYMEPNRDFDGVEELRRLVETDLDAALLLGLRMTVEQLISRDAEIGPNTMSALRFLEERNQAL